MELRRPAQRGTEENKEVEKNLEGEERELRRRKVGGGKNLEGEIEGEKEK